MTIKSILAVVAVISALSITLLITTTTNFKAISAQDTSSSNNTTTTTATSSSIKAHAGGGNTTDMLAVFVPQQIQVSTGQSITWDNPSAVAEPHTVTFVLDNKTMTNIVSAFTVPSSTQFAAIPPNSNNEPLKVPGQNNVVIAVNARSFVPTVIDSQGSVKHFAPPNAAYTMDGTEKYVNSGWLLPKGQEQFYPGSSTSFTVTFQKAGTYSYICQIHPWMRGSVVVK
ncbi:MAG: plastocyanin/azurin family copper-binding protein [Nitrososphaeraceae archaeon]